MLLCALLLFGQQRLLHNKNDLLPVIQKTLGVSKVKVRESIMAKKKKDTMEFRFYELPQGEAALVLCGESWVRVYGHEELHLHFHNLMELGICRQGVGDMFLDEEVYKYHSGDITIIPEKFPHVTVSDGETTNFWEYIFIDLRSMIETMFPGNVAFQNDAVSSLS